MTLVLAPAVDADLDDLIALRIEAMRESLERIGRFDPVRAGERLRGTFSAACTRHILDSGQRVGFVVLKQQGDGLLLDHLYVKPASQGRGIGAAVLALLFADADGRGLSMRVGALKKSDSNRFYLRHGFAQTGESEWDVYYVRPPAPPATQLATPLAKTNGAKA